MKSTATKNRSQPLEEEVIRLAEQLIQSAQQDRQGLYWLSYNRLPGGEPFQDQQVSIFSGTAGIVLFFIGLYQYTRQDNYLRIAREGTRWIESAGHETERAYLCFFSGQTGLVYLYLKMYEATHEKAYLDKATAHTQSLLPALRVGNGMDDFVSGEAGNLFVLTYLHAYHPSDWLLEIIRMGLNRLIDRAFISRQGLKWGYQPNSLDGVTGLSHGASGIGYVLLEMGQYFNSPALYWLAQQAFEYEAQHYRKKINNWLDLLVYTDHLENREVLTKKSATFLINRGDTNTWAYGTSGIGLVRLRAYEILKRASDQQEAKAAIQKTLHELKRKKKAIDFTLCSGLGGLAELLVAASEVLPETSYQKQIYQVANQAIALRRQFGSYPSVFGKGYEDPGLLQGLAGIGYFYLRVLAPHRVDSILLPRLPKNHFSAPSSRVNESFPYTLPEIRRRVWGKHFKRTLAVLETIDVQAVASLFEEPVFLGQNQELRLLGKAVKGLITAIPAARRAVVREAFRLEQSHIRMKINCKSILFLEVKHRFLKEEAQKLCSLPEKDFLTQRFQLVPNAKVLANRWPWENDTQAWGKNSTEPTGWYPVLLLGEACFVSEQALSAFSYFLLSQLHHPVDGGELIHRLNHQLAAHTIEEREKVRESVIKKLQQWLLEMVIEASLESNPASLQAGLPGE